jgi:hypothetical protein
LLWLPTLAECDVDKESKNINMSRIIYTFLILAILLPDTGLSQGSNISSIEEQLFALPDVIFKSIDTPEGFESAYELQVKQPIDHDNPTRGYFYQRVYLSHRSFDAPTVIITEGYDRSFNRMYELTNYLEANQVDVEHRYFGTSTPEEKDYQYLNLKQVTADLHHIRELLGQIYLSSWVSTGISKGGQTTIFYRYFYPDDVVASVPYVAPLNLELKEKRIYEFLANVGTEACREDIHDVQVALLKNREEVLPRLKWFSKGARYEFSYLTLEQSFEYAVLEYPFSFWQMGFDCAEIPDMKKDGLDDVLSHFMDVVGLAFYNDRTMEAYGSHYWQAGTEMGYYAFETEPFKGLLEELSGEPSAIFMPNKAPMTFEPTLVKKVFDWTQKEASEMIYIYGETDTWTATGVPQSDKVENAHWFILEGEDHGGARIKNMTEENRTKLITTLKSWLK